MSEDCLTNFEAKVLERLLAGDDPVLEVLREQLTHCTVAQRKLTGVGFFTHLVIPANVPRLDKTKRFTIAGVKADIAGVSHGAGFVLFVKNGVIDLLEGYTFDEPWPDTIEEFEISYVNGPCRDLES